MTMHSRYITSSGNKTLVFTASLFLILTGCGGGGSADDLTTDTPSEPANIAPTADAGVDQFVDERSKVYLTGLGHDADGTFSYRWEQLDKTKVALSGNETAAASFTAPSTTSADTLEFQLVVTDNDGAQSKNVVSITVNNIDLPFSVDNTITTLPAINTFDIVSEIVNLDLNFDGKEDLVVFGTNYNGFAIQALVNKGDGEFEDQTNTYFGNVDTSAYSKWVEKAYLVDLNNDGLLDIVSHADAGSTIPPLIQSSVTGFSLLTTLNQGPDAGGLIPLDIDNDGDVDLVSHNITDTDTYERLHEMRFYENTTQDISDVSFNALSSPITNNSLYGLDNGFFSYSPVVLDINNDNYDDLVYGGPKWKNGFVDEPAPIHVFLNSGSNTFTESSNSVFSGQSPEFTHLRELATGNFDNSGNSGIVVANHGYDGDPFPGEYNAILYNQGNGQFTTDIGNIESHNYKGFTHSVAVGDINNDGYDDIVYVDLSGDDVATGKQVRILINDTNGQFTNAEFVLDNSIDSNVWTSSHLIDLNNDNYPELVLGASSEHSDSLIIWNDGTGHYDTTP